MPEKHKLPKGALRLVAEGCHAHVEMAEGEDKTPKLRMTVYSGKPIEGHWYWGRMAIDLSGIKFDQKKYPVLEQHMTNRRIGFSAKPIVNGGITLNPETTKFLDNEYAQEFIRDSLKGFPFQASIYAIPTVLERVENGATVEVNGYKFKGPGIIWRKSLYQEASVCVFGWDKKTEAAAFSKEEVEVNVQYINNEGGDADKNEDETTKPKLKLRKGGEHIMPKTLVELKEKYPDLTKQLADEVTTNLQNTFDREKTAMQSQITQLSTEKEEMGVRVLSLEKNDLLRSEKELALTADRIWNEKLAASNIAEHLFDKVRKHVVHAKFVKDGNLDVAKFGEAIDTEIADWESRGATSTVLGAGFSTTEREVETIKLSKQEKSDDDLANHLLEMAGQKQNKGGE